MNKCNDYKMYEFYDRLANGKIDDINYPYLHYLIEITNSTFVFDVNSTIDIGKLYRNLKLIIEDVNAKEQIYLVNNLQKIFRKYICIDGLERLLATNYTDIEWSMFLEYDFNNERSQYYRDHFVHQFRDAYLALSILNSDIFHTAFKTWYYDQRSTLSLYIKNVIDKYIEVNNINRDKEEEIYFIIIYKSILLASVFHDLGYPASHFSRVAKQMDHSLCYHSLIFKTNKVEFQQIRSKLAASILFRSTNIDEIENKYNKNDHGVLSAILYLLNFYETSAINDLPHIERCIIELSAYAIYDHTNKYNKLNRMTFYENPISYLLRISDDLQEWSRFNITMDSNNNSMLYLESLDTIFTDDNKSYKICMEDSNKTIFLKTTNLNYKKLNYMNACSSIDLDDKDSKYIVNINYNKYSLLEIATINFNYAPYRNDELKGLKNMFSNQLYIPSMDVLYTLSNNVFFLSCELLNNFKNEIKQNEFLNILKSKDIEMISYEKMANNIADALEKIEIEMGKNNKLEKPLLYYNIGQKEMDSTKEAFLTTIEYSDYCMSSKKFLKKYIGLLGLINVLMDQSENL